MASRPAFRSLPSDYSFGAAKSTPGSETGDSSRANLTSGYLLDDLPGGRVAGFSASAATLEQDGSKRYGASYFGRSAPGERSPWRRPRILASVVVTLLGVIALATALPIALHRHDLNALNAGTSANSTVGGHQSVSTASAAASAPSSSAASPSTPLSTAEEFALIKARRRSAFAQGVDAWRVDTVPSWLASLKPDGSWPDVDYTSGCAAQRANWPAQEHLARTLALAAMASGLGSNATAPTTASEVGAAASSALNWWFAADFGDNIDCLAQGGNPSRRCPCGTRGLWNPNWFSNVIRGPRLISSVCLLLHDELSKAQQRSCDSIVRRTYDFQKEIVPTYRDQTGANLINILQNFVSLALYTDDVALLQDVMNRAMAVVTFSDAAAQDGIHRDGSYLQHDGILYSGNYGKDLLLAFIELEGQASGTSFAATEDARAAFAADIRGSEWMIHGDTTSKTEFWDLHALGRFIAFPSSELAASADINVNINQLAGATKTFTGDDDLSAIISRLSSNGSMTSANVGGLNGNRAFPSSDYMVHRRDGYVQSVKLLSTRSRNTEAINGANPFGFHVGIGSLFTYASGSEYLDIQAAWDWNLIPGTTTLLNLPKLDPAHANIKGVKQFVGVVSDGEDGIAVMDFAGAADKTQLAYRKTYFFLDDVVLVTTSSLQVRADVASTPVIAVLDNRRLSIEGIAIGGLALSQAVAGAEVEVSTLWHDNVGYLAYSTPFNLTYSAGDRTGNWSEIATSDAGLSTIPLFSAYTTLPRNKAFTYAIFPASPQARVQAEAADPTFTPLDLGRDVSAVVGLGRLAVVFWAMGRTASVSLPAIGWPAVDASSGGSLILTSDQPSAVLLSFDDAFKSLSVTFADPTQALETLELTLRIDGPGRGLSCDDEIECVEDEGVVTLHSALPTAGLAGHSVIKSLSFL